MDAKEIRFGPEGSRPAGKDSIKSGAKCIYARSTREPQTTVDEVAQLIEEMEASVAEWVLLFARPTEVALPLTRPVSYPPPTDRMTLRRSS